MITGSAGAGGGGGSGGYPQGPGKYRLSFICAVKIKINILNLTRWNWRLSWIAR